MNLFQLSILSGGLEDDAKDEFFDILVHIDKHAEVKPDFPSMLEDEVDNGTTIIEEEDCFKWNLYNSMFFSFTAVTTIGKDK